MMRIEGGRLKVSNDEIKQLVAAAIERRLGVKVDVACVWTGLVAADDPKVEAIVTVDLWDFSL